MSQALRQLEQIDGLSLLFDDGEAANPRLQFVQDPRQRPAPIPRPAPIYRPGEEPRARRAPQQAPAAPAPAAAPLAIAQPQPAPQSDTLKQLEQIDGLDLLFGDETKPAAAPAPAIAQPKAGAETGIDWNQPEKEIRAAIRMLPKGSRQAALDEWAKRRVGTERKANAGIMQDTGDVVRNLIRGTPVGSWYDEILATAQMAGGGDYDEAVAVERARNQAIDDSSTKLGTLPLIGDVTAGGLTKLAGGILSAPFSPAVRLAQGATMLPRVANAVATGATYGTVYGAGEGTDEASSRAMSAGGGGLIGLGLGAMAPVVATGVGNAVGGVRRALTQTPAALAPYDRGAVNRVARAVEDDMLTSANYGPAAQRLGPEGMLADMGDNLRGQAGAIANAPGAGQTIITRALEDRRGGAANRIRLDVDRALGQPVNVPRTIEATRQAANDAAGPLYQQFHDTPIQITENLYGILDRARAAGAIDRAQRLMAIDGFDPGDVFYRNYPNSGVDNAALNARFLDYVKRAVDDLAGPAAQSGERETARRYTDLARALRTEVDTILSPDDPAQSVWAQARRASGEGAAFEDALEAGQAAFRKNLSPDQMQMDMQGLSPHELQAYRVGARDNIRSTMGNSSAAYGSNADVAARRALQSNFAQDKLRLVTDRPADADRIVRRLEAESDFANTEGEVLRNSATQRRAAAQKEFPNAADREVIGRELGQRGLTGVALEGTYRIANFIAGGAIDERRRRIAENAARMLVAQGVERDQIAAGLRQFIQSRNLRRNQVQAVETIIERVMEGARQPAIANTVGE